MADTTAIFSIVIAVISFLGTLIVAIIGYVANSRANKRKEAREKEAAEAAEKARIDTLSDTYALPLMVVAYELQARLYELVEYPISKEHLVMKEGLEDIKIFTCYRFARLLAWTHIIKIRTQYFAFAENENLKQVGYLILRLNEEFDRRRGDDGQNVGVWPGARHLTSERMFKDVSYDKDTPHDKDAPYEKDVPLHTVMRGYNDFYKHWDTLFKEPMAYFCQWIDDMVVGRKIRNEHWDDAMRCTQHNLVDMVVLLDKKAAFRPILRKVQKPHFCDCLECPEPKKTLAARADTRYNDKGLRSWSDKKNRPNKAYDDTVTLERLEEMTCTTGFNQTLAGPAQNRRKN
jgi:hypothetical protein